MIMACYLITRSGSGNYTALRFCPLTNSKSVQSGKPQKNVLFLVARPLRPLAPPPLGLVAIGTFILTLKKFLGKNLSWHSH